MINFSIGDLVRVKLDHHDLKFRGERGRIQFLDVWRDASTAAVRFERGYTKEFYLDQIEHESAPGTKEQELPTKPKPINREVNRVESVPDRGGARPCAEAPDRNRPIASALLSVDMQIKQLEEHIQKLTEGLDMFLRSPLAESANEVSDGYVVDQHEPPLAKDIRQRASRLAGLRRDVESILDRLDP